MARPTADRCYAEAIEEALICSFTPQELQRLIDRFPSVGVNIIRYLSGRLAVSEREREVMAFRSVEQRLAARLTQQEVADNDRHVSRRRWPPRSPRCASRA